MKTILSKPLLIPLLLILTSQALYAFYDPQTQRWLNRDPLAATPRIRIQSGEKTNVLDKLELWQGTDLYQFVYNAPTSYIDNCGMWPDMGFPIDVHDMHNPVSSISSNWSALLHYLDGTGTPVYLTGGLALDFQILQWDQNWPQTSGPEPMCVSDYWSWSNLGSSLNVGFGSGQFRYTNDGKTTTVSDVYSFPWTYNNWPLYIFFLGNTLGTPYPVTGAWPTPAPEN